MWGYLIVGVKFPVRLGGKYVAPWIELWCSLIQIMDFINRIMEPHKSILPPPPLSIIDKYDRLKITEGNEFILLKLGWECCMAGNATKTDLLLCWTTHIILYHMYFTELQMTHHLLLCFVCPTYLHELISFHKDHSFWSVNNNEGMSIPSSHYKRHCIKICT